jgi:CRP-like cAMP-binding protein
MSWLKSLPIPTQRVMAAAGEHFLKRSVSPVEQWYLVHGRVGLGIVEDGRLAHRLWACEGPCWIDPASVLHRTPSLIDALTETDAELVRMPADKVQAWVAGLPLAARHMVLDLAMANRRQTEASLGLLVKGAEARFAEWLLHHAEATGQNTVAVPLRERKRSIAVQLGIAPETFSRILRSLREQGLVSQSGSVLNLIDPGGLQQLAGV